MSQCRFTPMISSPLPRVILLILSSLSTFIFTTSQSSFLIKDRSTRYACVRVLVHVCVGPTCACACACTCTHTHTHKGTCTVASILRNTLCTCMWRGLPQYFSTSTCGFQYSMFQYTHTHVHVHIHVHCISNFKYQYKQ